MKSFASRTLHTGWGWVESAQKVQHMKVSSSAKVDSVGTEGTVEERSVCSMIIIICTDDTEGTFGETSRYMVVQYVQEAH